MTDFYKENYSIFLTSLKKSILSEFNKIKETFKLFKLTNLSLSFDNYTYKIRFHFDRKSFVKSLKDNGVLIDKNLRDIINLGFLEYSQKMSLAYNDNIPLYENFFRHEPILIEFINKIYSIEKVVFDNLIELFPTINDTDEEFISTQLALVSFEKDIKTMYQSILDELFQDFKYLFELYSNGNTISSIHINKNNSKLDSVEIVIKEISELNFQRFGKMNYATYNSIEIIDKNNKDFTYCNIPHENKEKISNLINKLYEFLENSRVDLLPDVLN